MSEYLRCRQVGGAGEEVRGQLGEMGLEPAVLTPEGTDGSIPCQGWAAARRLAQLQAPALHKEGAQ